MALNIDNNLPRKPAVRAPHVIGNTIPKENASSTEDAVLIIDPTIHALNVRILQNRIAYRRGGEVTIIVAGIQLPLSGRDAFSDCLLIWSMRIMANPYCSSRTAEGNVA
jgi:hypothetical protein